MQSKFFKEYGIPEMDCEIETRHDDFRIPRLFFRSVGNPLVGLDLTGASQIRQKMERGGEPANANEIALHIEKAKKPA